MVYRIKCRGYNHRGQRSYHKQRFGLWSCFNLGTVDASQVKVDGIVPQVDDSNFASSYSALTHTLTVKISETGGIGAGQGSSAVDPGKFTVWCGTESKTLTSGQSSAVITDAATITLTIGGSDLTAIQSFTPKEKLDRLDVAAGGIVDAAGNTNPADSNNMVTTVGAADVAADKAALDITYAAGDSVSSVTQNLTLPTLGGNGSEISWQSDTLGTIGNDGTVSRPLNIDVQVVLTATISKSGVSDTKQFAVTVKNIPVAVTGVSAGSATITVTTQDGGKTATCLVTVTTPVTVVNGQTVTITEPTTINIPPGVTGPQIDVDPTQPLPEINVNASTTLGTVQIEIPSGTTVNGPAGWNGTITPPTVAIQANATISGAQSVDAVVEIGLNDETITFSQAVRLLIPGMAGKEAGYVRNGVFTPITRNLSADNQAAAGIEIPPDGDAKINAGADLAIWAKHFTQFVAYTPAVSGGGGGDSSGGVTTPILGQLVTPGGGIINYQGVIVSVPANTFSEEARILIYQVGQNGFTLPGNARLVSNIFNISLNKTLGFSNPVTVKIPFNQTGLDTSLEDLGIYYWDGSQWTKLDNITVDWETGMVSGDAKHFTNFAILAAKKAGIEQPSQLNGKDINGHWAQDNIRRLIDLGSVAAYPDGSVKPDNTITRAEFAVVLVNAFKIPVITGKVFDDTANHWARDYIASANAAGIIGGYDNLHFGPDDPVTREQMAVMVIKASGFHSGGNMPSFADSELISPWARDAVAAVANRQIMCGYSDNGFKPQANATRAEAFTVIVKSLPAV